MGTSVCGGHIGLWLGTSVCDGHIGLWWAHRSVVGTSVCGGHIGLWLGTSVCDGHVGSVVGTSVFHTWAHGADSETLDFYFS